MDVGPSERTPVESGIGVRLSGLTSVDAWYGRSVSAFEQKTTSEATSSERTVGTKFSKRKLKEVAQMG